MTSVRGLYKLVQNVKQWYYCQYDCCPLRFLLRWTHFFTFGL